jgi:hypothetical protein
MKSKHFNLLEQKTNSYIGAIGVDYFEHKYFYLSSKIGYMKRGGRDKVILVDEQFNILGNKNINERWNFLDVNTTFRFRYQINNYDIYIGIGPFVNLLIGKEKFTYNDLQICKVNKLHFGVLPEIGVNYYITEKTMIGINIAYSYNLSIFSKIENMNLYNNSINMSFTIGYRLF